MHTSDRDEAFQAIIQNLKKCERKATQLDLDFLPQLLSAAQIEAAIQWEGGREKLGCPPVKFEKLLQMKIRLALSAEKGGFVPVFVESGKN